ncbi:MAG: RNA polymerase sigma factor [Muribaculaceae bacterium]|nr:RNA polymerase sigma factor [Muribaculaceae bacterium]
MGAHHDIFINKLLDMQGKLYSFAYMLTSNRDDANDLLQDTTLKAMDSEDKYTDNTNFKGWVYTIMRNLFINNYRRMARSCTQLDNTEDLIHLNLRQDSGLETPEGAISVADINRAINSFSDDYRIPFSMHLAGYHYAEIARHVNLPLGTVKSRIYYARRRLQSMLGDYRG